MEHGTLHGQLSFHSRAHSRKAKERTAQRLAILTTGLLALGLLVSVNLWQNAAWPDWSDKRGTHRSQALKGPLTTQAAPDLIVARTAQWQPSQEKSQQLMSTAASHVLSSQVIGAPTTEQLPPSISGVEVVEQYVLLGAPTSLCWKNAARLETAFPAARTTVHSTSTRPGPRYQVPAHVCQGPGGALNTGNTHSAPEQLLQHVPGMLPYCASADSQCTTSQLFSLRYAVHAAAHATLRYYLPPGIMPQTQLDSSLQQSFHPLLCGPAANAVVAERWRQATLHAQQRSLGQPSPFLTTVCSLLPGMLQLMGAVASQGEASDWRWDPTLLDVPGKYNPHLWVTAQHSTAESMSANSAPQQDAGNSQREVANTSLDAVAAAAASTARQSPNYLVAFALHNAQRVMPHFVMQILALVTYLPPGRVLVSCYESASKDSTPQWLYLLQGLLDLLRIPNHFVIQGDIVREPGQERIPFLAAVRNAALAPLHNPSVYAAALKRVGHTNSLGAAIYPAHKIMFINDPFFSWQDIVRLSHYNADIACGLDIDMHLDKEELKAVQLQQQQQQEARTLLTVGQAHPDSPLTSLDNRTQEEVALALQHSSSARQQRRLQGWGDDGWFYDIWVARDLGGRRFEALMPLVQDELAQRLLLASLPFPVQCCWNAAVVMNARPFMPSDAVARPDGSILSHIFSSVQTAILSGMMSSKGIPATTDGGGSESEGTAGGLGLSFRAHAKGECSASECSLLCNDLWRLNHSRILVDPSVRMTYRPLRRALLHETTMDGLPMLTWQQMHMKLREHQINQRDFWTRVKAPEMVTCCPPEGTDSDRILWNQCYFDKRWRAAPMQGWFKSA